MDKKKNDEIVVIPGWMDRSYYHCAWNELNVWGQKIDLGKKIRGKYIVGHSAGSSLALLAWQHNKDKKVILINPLFPKRSFLEWTKRFFRFSQNEPLTNPISRIPMFLKILTGGFLKLLVAIKLDPVEIVKNMSKNSIFIIYGEKDNYFFDIEARKLAKEMDLNLIEIEEAGHNWHEKFNEVIEKIVTT